MSVENVFSPKALYGSFSRSEKFDHEKNRTIAYALKAVSEALSEDNELSPTKKQTLKERQKELKEKFVCGNVWLVVSVAHMFMKKYYDRNDLHIEDLIQEGMFGLFKAIEKYDPDRKAKFSTYAVPWIKSAISRYLQEDGVIKVPVWEQWLLNKKSNNPSEAFSAVQETNLVFALNALIVSELDLPITDDSKDTLLDAVSYDSPVFENVSTFVHNEKIQNILEEILTAKEMTVIKLYFGLNNNEPLVFEEIGKRLGVTRQMAHVTFKKAMEKLARYMKEEQLSLMSLLQ